MQLGSSRKSKEIKHEGEAHKVEALQGIFFRCAGVATFRSNSGDPFELSLASCVLCITDTVAYIVFEFAVALIA